MYGECLSPLFLFGVVITKGRRRNVTCCPFPIYRSGLLPSLSIVMQGFQFIVERNRWHVYEFLRYWCCYVLLSLILNRLQNGEVLLTSVIKKVIKRIMFWIFSIGFKWKSSCKSLFYRMCVFILLTCCYCYFVFKCISSRCLGMKKYMF